MKNILVEIREQLKINANEKIKVDGQRFFKEPIKCYGMKTATVKGIIKNISKKIKEKTKEEIFILADELWQSGFMEEAYIACELLYAERKLFQKVDFIFFENCLNEYVTNWASCDNLCNHTIAAFIEKYPEYISSLKTWTKSENRWQRRGSAVTLIIPARKGLFLEEIFEIADFLIADKDDLVQKAYGWMLKAASEAHQQEIYDYLISKKQIMPRTAYRYALEKMPKDLRLEAMKK